MRGRECWPQRAGTRSRLDFDEWDAAQLGYSIEK